MTRRFRDDTRRALATQGWRLAELPEGVSLDALRRSGAPFKGDRFFREHAARVVPAAFAAGELAYRPGLMPGSPGRRFAETDELLVRLDAMLPDGARAAIGSAAAYVWLLTDHHRRTGEWLLARCFTLTRDVYEPAGVPVVVGAMGGADPIVVSPLPEEYGRGVGLLPLVVAAPPPGR